MHEAKAMIRNLIKNRRNINEVRVVVLSKDDDWHTIFGHWFEQRQIETSLPQQIRLYAHQNKLLVAIKPHDPQQQLNISAKAIAQLCNTAFKTERRIQGVQLLLCYPATQASHQEQIRILECANTLCSHIHFQTKLHLLVNQWSDEANTVWHNLPADWNTSPWGVSAVGRKKNWTLLAAKLDNWVMGQMIPITWQSRTTPTRLNLLGGLQKISQTINGVAARLQAPQQNQLRQKLTGLWLMPHPEAKRSIAMLESLIWQRATPYKNLGWHLSAFALCILVLLSLANQTLNIHPNHLSQISKNTIVRSWPNPGLISHQPGLSPAETSRLSSLPQTHTNTPTVVTTPTPDKPLGSQSNTARQDEDADLQTISEPEGNALAPKLTEIAQDQEKAKRHDRSDQPAPIDADIASTTSTPQAAPMPLKQHVAEANPQDALTTDQLPLVNRPWRPLIQTPATLADWQAWRQVINLAENEWQNIKEDAQNYPEYNHIDWLGLGHLRDKLSDHTLSVAWEQFVNLSQRQMADRVHQHIVKHNDPLFNQLDLLASQLSGQTAATVEAWRQFTQTLGRQQLQNELQAKWHENVLINLPTRLKTAIPLSKTLLQKQAMIKLNACLVLKAILSSG